MNIYLNQYDDDNNNTNNNTKYSNDNNNNNNCYYDDINPRSFSLFQKLKYFFNKIMISIQNA